MSRTLFRGTITTSPSGLVILDMQLGGVILVALSHALLTNPWRSRKKESQNEGKNSVQLRVRRRRREE